LKKQAKRISGSGVFDWLHDAMIDEAEAEHKLLTRMEGRTDRLAELYLSVRDGLEGAMSRSTRVSE